MDEHGNVNVSKFKGRCVGCGGFINITQNAKKVVYCGAFTAGGLKVEVGNGKLVIKQEGKGKKYVKKVEQVTFSGAYAKQTKLNYTKLVNLDGKTVSPTSDAFMAAAANADWEGTPGFGVILTNQPGAASWPLAGTTFILMHKKAQKPVESAAALKFFAWAYAKGDKMAEDLDFVPMPDKVVGAIEKTWTHIKDEKGQPVFTGSN